MTFKEFAVIAATIKTCYSKENILANENAMKLWYDLLKDIPYDVAQEVVKEWISTQRWSPTVADIRELAAKRTNPELPEWSEAWESVINAIGRWGMHREAEALASMPEIAQQAVKRMGWQNICLSENVGVERATFRDIYIVIAKRKERDAQLPESLRITVTENPLIGG